MEEDNFSRYKGLHRSLMMLEGMHTEMPSMTSEETFFLDNITNFKQSQDYFLHKSDEHIKSKGQNTYKPVILFL